MTLEFVTHDETRTLNVLLYGPPKIGKTTGATSAPGPILYVNADTPNAVRFARERSSEEILEVKATGLQTLIDVVRELEPSPTKYGTVVVDPVGELYARVLEDISDHALSPEIQMYGDAGTYIERFCLDLIKRNVNVVFVLHEVSEKNEATGVIERHPFASTKSGSAAAAAKLMARVDVIGYCGIVAGEGDEADRYVAQLVEGNGRFGGDRTGRLGKVQDLDLARWVTLAQTTTKSTHVDESKKKEQK